MNSQMNNDCKIDLFITLLIIAENSDSDGVWKVGGVWNTTQRAELTERMKRLRATNTQPDNSTLRRMEGQEMTRLRQQLREMSRQKVATIHQFQSDIREKDLQIQRHEGTITDLKKRLQGQTMELEKLRKEGKGQ